MNGSISKCVAMTDTNGDTDAQPQDNSVHVNLEHPQLSNRIFHVDQRQLNLQYDFPDNSIKTSRYSLITFLPVNLFEQFRRLANFYFLVTVLLCLIPDVSPWPLWTVAAPLVFILAVSAAKAAYEDILRHRDDNRLNNKVHRRANNGTLEDIRSKDIQVGDILFLQQGEFFPADCILLATSNYDRSCYVNTAELDGETAPKSKRAMMIDIEASVESINSINGKVIAQLPQPSFGGFEGRLEPDHDEKQEDGMVGLGDDQLTLRGSKLASTEYAFGIVYATGKDTKIMLNRLRVAYKFSSFEKKLNNGVFFAFAMQFFINLTFAIGNTLSETFVELERGSFENLIYEFLTSFVLFTYLIPISLYVSMEFVRVGQGILIEADNELSVTQETSKRALLADLEAAAAAGDADEERKAQIDAVQGEIVYIRKKCNVRTTDIIDEMGQVEYIMSDKTGTLTKNKMELKAAFIDGVLSKVGMPTEEKEITMQDMVDAVYGNGSLDDRFTSGNSDRCLHYLLTLLLCNEVIVTEEKGIIRFQSLSPDEIAFVEAMQDVGLVLTSSTDQRKEYQFSELSLSFAVHGILKFSADRKRMTMVVEDEKSGEYHVLCKGADSMLANFLEETDLERQALEKNNEALERFARQGKRTLVMCSRKLTANEFQHWNQEYNAAILSLEDREGKIENSFSHIEKRMKLLGCTAVEDPLQDGVPEAVDQLIDSGIIVIVLTGDKQETAVAIGTQANIVHSDTRLLFINGTNANEVNSELLDAEAFCENPNNHKQALVINGDSLQIAIVEFPDTLLNCLSHCQTIICSRATPAQKAGMVRLVRRRLKKICLAIGDGANDVSMIQKANVGIGLTGKEGTQAAQASDFVLHRFRHLPRLLFVHGRYSYLRTSKVVLWSFYKNTFFPLPLFFYGFFSSFSDQPLFDSLIMTIFNMVFTVFPPLVIGFTEKDAQEKVLMDHPVTYQDFRENNKFSLVLFVKWIGLGWIHAIICYFFAVGVFYDTDVISSDGKVSGLFTFGMWQCTAIIIIINIVFLCDTINWTPLIVLACFLGAFLYVGGWILWSNWLTYIPDLYGVGVYIFQSAMSYFYVFLVIVLCVFPLILHNQFVILTILIFNSLQICETYQKDFLVPSDRR